MNYYITDVQWRSNGRGGPPRAALLGGGKIEGIAEKLGRGKASGGGGEILGRAFK